MIRGLEHFTQYFADIKNEYVIIGGTASTILLENAGINFRATKDIGLVIIATQTEMFADRMIQYIKEGQYKIAEKNNQKPRFYRFKEPGAEVFPVQIEIFHKKPDGIDLFEKQHIVPIKTPHEDMGISAILLDEEYFKIIQQSTLLNGIVPVTSLLSTITLKAKAFNDLIERQQTGEQVDSHTIRKHQKDVFKLAMALTGDERLELSGLPREHFQAFIYDVRHDVAFKNSFKSLRLELSLEDTLVLLEKCLLLKK